jgi:adenylate cyclase
MATPVAEIPAEPRETVAAPSQHATRIVLVDDSAIALAFVEEGLASLGFHVTSFNDPVSAYAHLETAAPSERPDLVVTDLNMPPFDGAELCRRIKTLTAGQLPVVILTADDSETALVGLRAGADDYVRKGTSLEELAARIDGIVRRTSATERVKRLFARYTSDAVVDEILRAGEVVLSGEKRVVTVLFADIRGFTAIAETLPPEHVMHALNDLLGRFADAVLTCGGTLDKFLGDGLMAVFGAPVGRDDDPRRALTAAQLMLEAARARNAEPNVTRLEVGIGINTGIAIAGSLGSERRVEYTCIGDTVNVASRLCALAGPGEILVGEETAHVLDLARFEALPAVQLKGKSQAIPIFRVPRVLPAT